MGGASDLVSFPAAGPALCAALLFGAGDFLGGIATRRSSALVVATISQATGLVAVLLFCWATSDASGTTATMGQAIVAGLASAAAATLLYMGLATGAMNTVAPASALCSVGVPVVVGISFGDRLSIESLAGVVTGIAAVALLASVPASVPAIRGIPDSRPSGLGIGAAAGVASGASLVALQRISGAGFLAALGIARLAGLAGLVSVIAFAGSRPRPAVRGWIAAAASGLCDIAGVVMYLAALRNGAALSEVATLTSLYPLSTIALARIILGERFRRNQAVAITLAFLALILMTAGR